MIDEETPRVRERYDIFGDNRELLANDLKPEEAISFIVMRAAAALGRPLGITIVRK